MEGLRALGVPQAARARSVKKAKRERHDAGTDATDADAEVRGKKAKKAVPAADGPPGFQQRLSAAKAEGAGLAYIPAAKFGGARPGYMFKLGGLGLGYYRDAAASGGKKAVGASASGGVLPKGKRPIMPIGPQSDGRLSDSDDDGDNIGGAPPPSRLKQSQPQSKKKAAKVGAGESSSRGGGGSTPAAPSDRGGRRKALPGRLRKKLAKAKEGS